VDSLADRHFVWARCDDGKAIDPRAFPDRNVLAAKDLGAPMYPDARTEPEAKVIQLCLAEKRRAQLSPSITQEQTRSSSSLLVSFAIGSESTRGARHSVTSSGPAVG
jgi:hypothetical protein